jgi:hypothetical protein
MTADAPRKETVASMRKYVFQLLEEIEPFPARRTRKNIIPEGQEHNPMGFALGTVFTLHAGVVPSRFNKVFPDLLKACKQLMHAVDPSFRWNCIQVNKNQLCAPHVDRNNEGPSYIVGLGDYTGGELGVQLGEQPDGKKRKTTILNIKNRFKMFDGHHLHWTLPFQGTRYTLVFFRIKVRWKKAKCIIFRTS